MTKKIKLINERVEQIKNDTTISLKMFLQDDTDLVFRNRYYINYKNGKVLYSMKNDTLIKLCHDTGGEFGFGSTTNYYFHNNQLICVRQWWGISGKSGENVYYIDDQKLIKSESSTSHKKDMKILMAEVEELIDLLKEN